MDEATVDETMARDRIPKRSHHTTASRTCAAAIACLLIAPAWGQARAACGAGEIARGRVAKIIDARTLMLEDGEVVRLAGIEPIEAANPPEAAEAAAGEGEARAALAGREIILFGTEPGAAARDRYGRLSGFARIAETEESIQDGLIRRGLALASAHAGDRDCVAGLLAAENEARQRKAGAWGTGFATKNAESPDEITERVGQFLVAEGSVSSVREAGATIYVNFGRRWTRDLAATIPKRLAKSFERAGLSAKSMERRKVRVRGWVEMRGGPRIAVARPEQIEVLTEK